MHEEIAVERNWTETETKALLYIRADEEFCRRISGTVRDSIIYGEISRILRAQGIHRTKRQVTTKLKTLKQKFLKIYDHHKNSSHGKIYWNYYELCKAIWGTKRATNTSELRTSVKLEEPQSTSIEVVRYDNRSTDIEVSISHDEETNGMTEVITPPPRKKAKKGHIGGFIREQEPLHIPEQREYEELLRREAREEQKEERESLMAMWKEMMEFQGNLLKEFIHRPSLPSSHPPYHKHGHYNQGSSFPSTSYLAPYHSPGAETEIESAISQEEEEEEEEKYVIPATIPLISDSHPVNCANDSQSNLTVTLSPPPTQSAEKTDLELSVLRRQERVLQLQEEYYSLKIQHLKAKMAMEPTQKHKEAWQIQQVS
ncbi:uncharacterized protein LOC127646739 isoform X1 [Xyrauchen texanus]|uniref:uncharacterized protein LOC127646739 isoform X1 n=1 Tax=Xyrauchen texanus TaxID=154827 RepID=UPI002242B7D8|nr:uncharacterized protein LOC127646739 isoform X1 [Xyrauchen texanus]